MTLDKQKIPYYLLTRVSKWHIFQVKLVEIPCQLWIVLLKLYYCADRFRNATHHVCKKDAGMVENCFLQAILYLGTAIEKGFWLYKSQVAEAFPLIFTITHLHKQWVGLNFPHCPWTNQMNSPWFFWPLCAFMQQLGTRFVSCLQIFLPRSRGSPVQGGHCLLIDGARVQESRLWKTNLVFTAWDVEIKVTSLSNMCLGNWSSHWLWSRGWNISCLYKKIVDLETWELVLAGSRGR